MRICKINNCNKKHKARGYCNKHCTQLYKTGSPFHAVKKTTVERITEKIKVHENGCWIWTGAKLPEGYGIIYVDGRHINVTRVIMQIACDIEIGNDLVLHKCDNPPCVNPSHLFLGNYKDNAIDMMKKGRCGVNKLTDDEVLEIRELYPKGQYMKDIANMYNVDISTISLIINRKRWAHL